MKKIILILILGLFLVSLVSAAGTDDEKTWDTIMRGDCIKLEQSCGNCTYVNITTITYPNKTAYALEGETKMTKAGTHYNYTFCSTNALGEYVVSGHGDPDGIVEIWKGNFEATLTGKKEASVLDNPLQIALLVFALLFLIMGIKLEMEWLGFLGGIMFSLNGMYILIYGFNYIENMYTQGIGITLSLIGVVIMLVAGYEWISRESGS